MIQTKKTRKFQNIFENQILMFIEIKYITTRVIINLLNHSFLHIIKNDYFDSYGMD